MEQFNQVRSIQNKCINNNTKMGIPSLCNLSVYNERDACSLQDTVLIIIEVVSSDNQLPFNSGLARGQGYFLDSKRQSYRPISTLIIHIIPDALSVDNPVGHTITTHSPTRTPLTPASSLAPETIYIQSVYPVQYRIIQPLSSLISDCSNEFR